MEQLLTTAPAVTAKTPRVPAALNLDTPVQFVRGVGPKRGEALARLGVRTVGDLVEYFPFRHEEHRRTTIEQLEPDMIATVVGQVTALRARRHGRGPAAQATVTDNTGRCAVTWFNAGYVLDQIERGMIVELTGKVGEFGGLPQFVNPAFRVLDANTEPVTNPPGPPFARGGAIATLEPVYPATAELNSRAIAKLIAAVLPEALPLIEELYSAAHREARRLPPRRTAIERMHRPTAAADVEIARRRLAYDELLVMQVAVQRARRQRADAGRAPAMVCTAEIDQRIRRRFPFALTAAQERVIGEITADLAQPRPMHRLLQGDVGCGKTAVAMYAALVVVANRRQVALLAPTELLAEQHHRSITRVLEGSRVRHALWIGGGPARHRAEMQLAAQSGRLDLVVGTQALLERDVQFERLGLVIVDEQHRFGVRQRATLLAKGVTPHYLVMTATPIPRTLAMTVYGDLDISTIDALPPGRAPVRTKVVTAAETAHAWRFVRSRIALGEQAYVVYPLVEESDALPLRAATAEAARLARGELAGTRVALLHGRMKPAEKDAVMRDFAERRADVLVATTVVEVGIDMPNATVMVVQHAERYGLAQLHQLRGRVGRGGKPGYCYLMTDASGEPVGRVSRPDVLATRQTASSRVGSADPTYSLGTNALDSRSSSLRTQHSALSSRLAVLAQTSDGFAIAEEDLRLRGPGELLGTRQHGLPALRAVDFTRDLDLLRAAQRDATDILSRDAALATPEWSALRRAADARWGARPSIGTVG